MGKVRLKMRSTGKMGCLNMALWDFLLIGFCTGYGAYRLYELHPFYSLLVGIGSGILLILLMRIPFLGALLQVACGIFWSQVIWRVGIHFHPTQDPIWIWGMQILLGVVFIALHFASVNALLGPKEEYRYQEVDPREEEERYFAVDLSDDEEIQDRFEDLRDAYLDACDERDEIMDQAQELLEEQESESLYHRMMENDKVWTEGSTRMGVLVDMLKEADTYREQASAMKRAEKLLDQLQRSTWEVSRELNRVMKAVGSRTRQRATIEEPKNTAGEIETSLFAGCTNPESLSKRYRSLMKTFHPDNMDGDSDMTIKIQKTYEYLQQEQENRT